MKRLVFFLIMGLLLSSLSCRNPKYEITLTNETYYAKAILTIEGKVGTVYPQSSEVVTELKKGHYHWDLELYSTLGYGSLGSASGSIHVDEPKTLVVFFSSVLEDYAYYWE